jgi:hypothetical protein
MASVTISMHFADGDVVAVTAKGASTYPDALHQLGKEAFDQWSDAVAYALAIQGTAPEDEAD